MTNDEAADYLRLSPRTLEKQRVIGGGPKFRKFGRRVMYAVSDLDAWADQRSYEATSDPEYAEQHSADSRARLSAARRRPSPCPARRRSGSSSTCSAPCRATWHRATARI
ncbi:helix-turn-helix domain-containing protein [Escherichia coli]|uniref:helix-turn-helix domain-containing protein n=1 Tax=Escherichia coli TaxID=562 RepID=UPI003D188D78